MGSAEEVPVIEVKHVGKNFRLPHERTSSIKELVIKGLRRGKSYEVQQALKDINFSIKSGEFFGIVGRNGSGKSTLLKLLAGIYMPTKGDIQVRDSLTPFIELGVGFNPELTGRENVFLNGALLGFSHKEMAEMYDSIVEFAELDIFMDQKLKNYSSGMQVRLAFSIAIRANTGILLLDEVLAVGDAIFQKKCFNYFKELKRQKKTVVFVSHDSNSLQEYCDKGILIEKGVIVSRGKIDKVVRDYMDILNEEEEKIDAKESTDKKRWGSGAVRVTSIETYDPKTGASRKVFTEDHPIIGIRVTYEARESQPEPIYGITVSDASDQRIFHSNTLWSKIKTKTIVPGKKVIVQWEVPNVYNVGSFRIAPAAADHQGATIYDWWDDATVFKIRKTLQSSALTNTEHNITIQQG